MNQYARYMPHTSTTVWIILGLVILFRLNFFLQILKEVISEKLPDGSVGAASSKRFAPTVFTLLICYMVVGYMRAPADKDFNDTAFWGLLLFLSLATTVLTYSQASNLLDKVNIFKGKAVSSKSEEITVSKKTEETAVAQDQQNS